MPDHFLQKQVCGALRPQVTGWTIDVLNIHVGVVTFTAPRIGQTILNHCKFQCFCKLGTASLEADIREAKEKIPRLVNLIEGAGAQKATLEADIKQAPEDREAAQEDRAQEKARCDGRFPRHRHERQDHERCHSSAQRGASADEGAGGAHRGGPGGHARVGAFEQERATVDEDHSSVMHFNVKGQLEYHALLVVPLRATLDHFKGDGYGVIYDPEVADQRCRSEEGSADERGE